MFQAENRIGTLLRSMQSHLRAVAASAGALILALAVFVSFHRGPYAIASESGPLASNMIRTPGDLNWRQSPIPALILPARTRSPWSHVHRA